MSESTTPEPGAIDPTAIASLTPNPLTPVAPTRMWSMANPLRTGFLLTLGALGALVIGLMPPASFDLIQIGRQSVTEVVHGVGLR